MKRSEWLIKKKEPKKKLKSPLEDIKSPEERLEYIQNLLALQKAGLVAHIDVMKILGFDNEEI